MHGHNASDQVLAAVAGHIIKHLRPYDQVFRYGGEEFLLCMPFTDIVAGEEVALRICKGISSMAITLAEGKVINMTVSIGVAILDPVEPIENSVDLADKAMYAAKKDGRDCVRVAEISAVRKID